MNIFNPSNPINSTHASSRRFSKMKKNGIYKIISFFAKKARGMMSRYIIHNQLTNPEAIKHFDIAGYRFSAGDSSQDEWIFTRAESKFI